MQSRGVADSSHTVPALIASARAHVERGDFHSALAACGKVIRTAPEDADSWTIAAAALSKLGRWTSAEECCRRALRLDPNSAKALANLGAIRGAHGKWDEARELHERAIALGEDPWRCSADLALALLKAADAPMAVSAAASAAQSAPENPYARGVLAIAQRYAGLESESEGSIASVDHMLGAKSEPYRKLAWLFHGFEQYRMAAHYLRLLAERATPTASDHTFLGVMLHHTGRRQESILAFQEAVRLEPKHARARSLLGLDYLHLNEYEGANEQYRALRKIDPVEAASLLQYMAPFRRRRVEYTAIFTMTAWATLTAGFRSGPYAPLCYALGVALIAGFTTALLVIRHSERGPASPKTR